MLQFTTLRDCLPNTYQNAYRIVRRCNNNFGDCGFCYGLKESAKGAVEIARKHFPEVKCKWGDEGLNEIIQDSSIVGVAVVVAGQTQVSFFNPSLHRCIQI